MKQKKTSINKICKFNALLILLLLSTISKVLAQDLVWVKSMPGDGFANGNAIYTDQDGNIHVTGDFTDTADFDMGPGFSKAVSAGGTDIFIAKYNDTGGLLWNKTIGGHDANEGTTITGDKNGNVYVGGNFKGGLIDFDPGAGVTNLRPLGHYDIFIVKFDKNGNFIWAKSIGGSSADLLSSIAVDDSGNVYGTGSFIGPVDFDPGPDVYTLSGSTTSRNIHLFKLDSSGNFRWAKMTVLNNVSLGVTSEYDIVLDSMANVYTTGRYWGNKVDFDPGPDSLFFTDVINGNGYFNKFDRNGNLISAKAFGGKATNGYALTRDNTGNLYILGKYDGLSDFDPGAGTSTLSGLVDIFVAKFTDTGRFCWVRDITGTSTSDVPYDIQFTGTNLYISGTFGKTMDFDPGPSTASVTVPKTLYTDGFILKLDTAGNYRSHYAIENIGHGFCQGISIAPNGAINVTGSSYTCDFKPGPDSVKIITELSDVYIVQLKQNDCYLSASADLTTAAYCKGDSAIITLSASGGSAPYQGIGMFKVTAGSHQFIVSDINKCTDTIDVIVTDTININTKQSGDILSAEQSGASYQWYDCDSRTIIPGATSKEYSVPKGGNYSVIITIGSCSDTSDCRSVIPSSIAKSESLGLFKLSPNPNNGNFTISTPVDIEIQVNSLLGQVVQNSKLKKGHHQFSMNLAPGIYYLSVKSAEEFKTYALIIQ